jgi:hypothetical protein
MLEIFGISLSCIVVGVQMTEVFKFVQALALVARVLRANRREIQSHLL